MTIYNINLGIGWASSGVEYAQSYRAELLRNLNTEIKFIFLDFINSENIQTYTENIGFKDEEIIWIYQYFTDVKIHPSTYTLEEVYKNYNISQPKTVTTEKVVQVFLEGNHTYLKCYLKNKNENIVDRVDVIVQNKLIRKDFYTYTKICSEYYAPNEGAKLYMRQFFNEDGTIAYREHINKEESMFEFDSQKLYSKQEFVAYFMQCLNLTNKDIVILDRGKGVAQSVIQNKGESKLGVVVHAEHFSENNTSDQVILWNNFYEYQFMNHQEVDFYITATDRQNERLKTHFKKYLNVQPKIYTIPVGSLKHLQNSQKRKPFSMITASRLAKEKHLDWLVLATVRAKQSLPDLSLDIYGEGSQRQMLTDLIRAHKAESYIQLKGHVHLESIYPNYEVFLSGSTSEGFGLTLMEAIGSGLGMIGLNVEYGNPTFIQHDVNGKLIDYHRDQDNTETVVRKLADAVIDLFTNHKDYHDVSYKIAEDFLSDKTVQKWATLVREVCHD
ncbi:accessory Sec system glycosyltransferase GtfA [Macrococcus sp. DPC7161]|uniref:accessory Sec system glycosyltransferase GtfA n=1 Tax=Macrococcus sp. DPC7161 TaxID=2507060 RepID=UPI00100C1123|nr:accessory Sec system glycosyltransferase GtfA [Macrococcus sp. DPC7161]RXK17628.1 accessory Sec system glycosyltransferase GtfA [Macrococcus sp. DPC7161]